METLRLGVVQTALVEAGLFIARIFRGRTVRELIGSALVVPTLVTLIWMSVFGGSALKDEQQARHAYASLPVSEQAVTRPFKGGPILERTRRETITAMFSFPDARPALVD